MILVGSRRNTAWHFLRVETVGSSVENPSAVLGPSTSYAEDASSVEVVSLSVEQTLRSQFAASIEDQDWTTFLSSCL